MYPKRGTDAKRPKKTTGKRSILTDINMLENSCEINSKPPTNNSSSCDSSDCEDEPVVKRPRKTIRRIVDPSEILPTEYSPAKVYTTAAKKSFEEINSSNFDFSKYCLEEKDESEEKEQKSKGSKNKTSSEIDDDLIIVENDHSPQGSEEVTCVGSQSPEPPSPPPPVTTKPKRTRANRMITKEFDKIQSSLKKIDKALKSDGSSLDDSVIIVDDNEVQEESSDSPLHNFDKQIVVMVKIVSEIKRFPMNKTDTFCNLFSFLSQEKEVPESRLMLVLDEKTIHQNETPASIQLQVADILDCFITDEEDQEGTYERTGPNVISLVIQSSINHKSKKTMQIGKFEMLQGIIDMYAKQNKLQAADLKLRFDGEIVDPSQTPADLDMEDEDCLDLIKA